MQVKASKKIIATLCSICMIVTLLPAGSIEAAITLPDIVIADFTEATPPTWSGGNMTLVDAPQGSGVSGRLAMLETKATDNKYGTYTVSGDWSDYGIDATGTDAPDPEGCGYFNMWVYSPEIMSNASGSSAFAVMIITNTRSGDTFEPATERRLQAAVDQNFKGWKLISIPMVDYPENGDGSPKEKFERRNLNHAPTWSSIKKIQFAVAKIGGCNVIEGNKLYFSKIWVSKEKPGGAYSGIVTTSIANNEGLANEVFVDHATNEITFTAEENLLDYLGSASLEIKRHGGEYSAVNKSDYTMSISGKTVTVSFDEALSSHRGYRVKISDIYTQSYKTFSKTVEFKTTGFGQVAQIFSRTIENGDSDVALDSEIAFEFDDDVIQSTGSLKVEVSADGESYSETLGAALSAAGNKLSVVLGADMLPRRKYRITIDDVYVGTALKNFSTLFEFSTLGYGQSISAISQSIENNAENVEPTEVITFTFDELMKDGSGSVKVEKAAASGPYSEILGADLVFSEKTVRVNCGAALTPRSRYRITITDVYTQSYKSFNAVLNFSTVGIEGVYRNDLIGIVYDFDTNSEAWTGGNVTTEEVSAGEYNGKLGLLKSYGETKTNGTLTFAQHQDWSNVEKVNILMYSPKSVPTSKFAFLVNTKRNNGQGTTFFKSNSEIAVDFAGWKVVSIPVNEFIPRTSDEEFADWSLVTGLTLAIKGYGSAGFSADTEVYFKEVWVSKSGENTLKDINLKKGEMNVPASSMIYSEEYDSVIHNSPYAATAKFINGNSEIGANVAIIGGKVTVSPKNQLAKGTNYTLKLNGLYFENGSALPERNISFTTTSASVYAQNPVISEDEYGNVNVTFTIINDTESTANIRIAARLLNAQGIEADYQENTSVLVAALSSVQKTLTFTNAASLLAQSGATDVLNYCVNAYAIGKGDNIPIMRHVRKYPDNSITPLADVALSDANITFNAKVRDTKLIVSGECASEGVRSVFITVLDEGTEKYSNIIEADAKGTFSVSYDITPFAVQGKTYTVNVYPYMGSVKTDTFYVATSGEKAQITSTVNSASSVSDVEALLNIQANRNVLGIKTADIKNTALVLFEQKNAGDTFLDIAQNVEVAESTISQLNTVHWADMAQFILDNKEIIFGNEDFQSKFLGKSPEEQNTICSELVKNENYPFNSFKELRSAITSITSGSQSGSGDTSQDVTGDSSSTDTGYGGGFGNGGSGSGGGGNDKKEQKPTPDNTNTPDNTKPQDGAYSDLGGHEWAKNAIEELSRKGIISGDGNGNFRPQDSVKREEFVKMLVEALDISTDGSNADFSDAKKGAWYEKYLTAAKNSGISMGREDGTFGIGENILRQDLAVMMLRALEAVGKAPKLSENTESFSDASAISKYAQEAVSNMQSNGFIQGMGDGSFAPMQSATRAQAAVIIKRILDYIGGSDTLL